MTQTQTDLLLYVDQEIHHSGSQRGNPLSPLHGLLFSMGSKGSFLMHYLTKRIQRFVISFVEHWLKREIAQWDHYEGPITRPIAL